MYPSKKKSHPEQQLATEAKKAKKNDGESAKKAKQPKKARKNDEESAKVRRPKEKQAKAARKTDIKNRKQRHISEALFQPSGIDLTDDLPASVPPRNVAGDFSHLPLSFWDEMLYRLATALPPEFEEDEEDEEGELKMFDEGFLFREDWASDVTPSKK